MQVIIMAGGEGSRLRPLTCGRPKPLVPVLNKPVMEHAINLLKKHGLTDIGVTLQYLPDEIKDYFGDGSEFGVSLKYFIEETPLGTAGSVKNAEDFLKETFMVISGDALTDFNLTQALTYHKEKQAMATLVLTRVEYPLEYGVVITGENGEIIRFLEKPSWGEVFSDTVNTGIYVLEPEVLTYFAKDTKFDFSQDLFPMLLKEGQPLFGCILSGYWCDIGNLQQYQQAHFDILDGKVNIDLAANKVKEGIWVEEGVDIDQSAHLEGPLYIGANSIVGPGVKIGAHTVLGENVLVGEGSSFKRTVLWKGVQVGKQAELRGTVMCNQVRLENNTAAFEGSVLGDNTLVRERSLIKPNVKIWPGKVVEKHTIVQNSLIWGCGTSKTLFGLDGATGTANVDVTPEWAARLGAAYGSTIKDKAPVTVSCTHDGAAHMIKQAVCSGLLSAGVKVLDLGSVNTAMARYGVKALTAFGGIHIKSAPDSDEMKINFFNKEGASLSKGEERKIENLFVREDFQRATAKSIGAISHVPDITQAYISSLMEMVNPGALRNRSLKLVLAYDINNMGSLIPPLMESLGCELITQQSTQIDDLVGEVLAREADLGAYLDHNGESIKLVDNNGRIIEENQMLSLMALMIFKGREGGKMAVPVTASSVIDELAREWRGQVVRTKTSPHDLMANLLKEDVVASQGSINQFLMNFDGVAALLRIMEFIVEENLNLAQIISSLPETHMVSKTTECPWEAKGRVMRRLIEEKKNDRVELLDGIKIQHDDGWALVMPDAEEPVYRVYSEAFNQEAAESLTDFYIDKIKELKEK